MSPEADRKTPVLNDNNAGIAPEDFTVEQCNTDICGVVSDSISNPSDALPATAQQSHHESEGSAGDDLDETLIHTLFVEIAAVADQLQSGSYAKDMRYMLKLIFEMYSTTTAETTNDDKISLDFSQSPSGSATPSANESQRTRAMDASLAQDALLAQRTTSISSNQASATGLRDPMGSTLIMRPSWKHDDDAPICTRCGLSFTVIRYVICGFAAGEGQSVSYL
jgi:hypothetical protein